MAYGSDITEALPYSLSNPIGATAYDVTNLSYDLSIDGKPWFIQSSDETPHRRSTAPYRKQQIDQSREPGEQSLTGWWMRSQSSFHCGAGIKFYDPGAGESIGYRFYDSQGLNVWEKGKVVLLKDTTRGHYTTTTLNSNTRPEQHLRSIQWVTNGTTYDGALLHDGYDVDKVYPTITNSITNKSLTSNVATLTTASAHGMQVGMEITVSGVDSTFNGSYTITTVPTTTTFTYAKTFTNVTSAVVSPVGSVTSSVINFIDYISGTNDKVFAICDDGTYAYWLTNDTGGGAGKLRMYKKLLIGVSGTGDTLMFSSASITITSAHMEWVKDRIVAAVNGVVYEIAPNAGSLPSPVYTNPNSGYIYTSVSASGPAIYTSGFSGIQSTIQKYTLVTSTGSMPTLSAAAVAAEFPAGEVVHKIFYYLGYMMIGTSRGVRAAMVNDQDGSLDYGPLIVETSQPIYDFAARDRFIWCASGVAGDAGVIRIDLGQPIEQEHLRFAYANDLQYVGDSGHNTTAVCFLGSTNRLAFSTAATSSNGSTYFEEATTLRSSGYVTTGKIRYATLEGKIFKNLKARIDNNYGGVQITVIDSENDNYVIGNYSQGDFTGEIGIPYPTGSQEYLTFKFTLSRSTTDSTQGAIMNGYQVKALPAAPRQRLIEYPLACYDHEADKFGVSVGYEGRTYDRIVELETVENAGDSVKVYDFKTGESYSGVIEQIDFINRTPSDKRFSGFGGILLVQIRTL
jgi:hypothetical protein